MTTTAPPGSTTIITSWPTPIYHADLTDHGAAEQNKLLRDLILAREQEAGSHTFGVVRARKSSTDLLTLDDPAVDWLRHRIRDAVDAMNRATLEDLADRVTDPVKAEAWAVVYRSGGSHRQHVHHDSVYSGVYYIATGGVGEQDGGRLQMLDPRPAAIARAATPGVAAITPQPGHMVAFPSWLPHSVQATLPTADDPRICVAFNVAYEEEHL